MSPVQRPKRRHNPNDTTRGRRSAGTDVYGFFKKRPEGQERRKGPIFHKGVVPGKIRTTRRRHDQHWKTDSD